MKDKIIAALKAFIEKHTIAHQWIYVDMKPTVRIIMTYGKIKDFTKVFHPDTLDHGLLDAKILDGRVHIYLDAIANNYKIDLAEIFGASDLGSQNYPVEMFVNSAPPIAEPCCPKCQSKEIYSTDNLALDHRPSYGIDREIYYSLTCKDCNHQFNGVGMVGEITVR